MSNSLNGRKAFSRGGDSRNGSLTTGEMNQRNLAEKRHKKGECVKCGNKTHKIGLFGKRTALTTEGLSLFGRCLLCDPVEGNARRSVDVSSHQMNSNPPTQQPRLPVQFSQQPPMAILPSGLPSLPHGLVIEAEYREGFHQDDNTIVSGITMDPRLREGARNWNGEYLPDEISDEESTGGYDWPVVKGRPEPSVSGMDEISRPPTRTGIQSPNSNYRQTYSQAQGYNNHATPWNGPSRPPFHVSMQNDYEFPYNPEGGEGIRSSRTASPSNESRRSSTGREERKSTGKDSYHFRDEYGVDNSQLPSHQMTSLEFSRNENLHSNHHRVQIDERSKIRSVDEADDEILRQAESYGDAVYDREPRMHERNGYSMKWNVADGESLQQSDIERNRVVLQSGSSHYGGSVWSNSNGALSNFSAQKRRGLPDDDNSSVLDRSAKVKANVRKPREAIDNSLVKSSISVEDIGAIINDPDDRYRDKSFKSLTELILSEGQQAKLNFTENDGIRILVESIFNHMPDSLVMESICELLFALVASSDGKSESDVLIGNSAEGAVDALLITMQTHINVETIQWSGCGTLNCLASASSSNSQVPDGSESGSVFIVVNAMDNHRDSQLVQEWGIRALYSLCMLSRHAEYNKRNLVTSGSDGGGGIDVISNAMEVAKTDLVTLELACRLYWSLAANEDVAQGLMETPEAFSAIMNAVERNHKKTEAAPMMEAAFGAFANFARAPDERCLFRDSNVIDKATQSIQAYHYDEVLYVEACALLGVLATDRGNMQNLMTCDVVNVIAKLFPKYDHNQLLQEEALWALICLTYDCDNAKHILSSESNATIGTLVRIMRDTRSSLSSKEMACTLIGSLCTLKESANIAVTNGAIDAVLALIRDFPVERRIHEAAFVALRNVTIQVNNVDFFLRNEVATMILTAASFTEDSSSAQTNICCLFWNVCAKTRKDKSLLVDAGAIANIVRAMQVHYDSGEVLEMACGALWCLIDKSESRKKELLACGAIDAVNCALVMHPNRPATLEKACGLLANVCTTTHMAEAIAQSQGISNVVDAMTANSTSMTLLELGTLVLRNIVLTDKNFAAEALKGIPIVLRCMRENPDKVGFQREACNALWALAAQSSDCKDEILNRDGVSILMATLEHNSCVGDVQEAARGAINQLASSSPS
jgi:hypothetical protein